MQQHLISVQILSDDIILVHSNDGQTQEQMEVIRLVIRPTGFPHSQSYCLSELTLETSER